MARPDIPPATRRVIVALTVSQGVLFALLGIARHVTFHNETFDLAFYTRIAWGLVRNDFWEPLVDAHVYGLHLSPVLVPLGAARAADDCLHHVQRDQPLFQPVDHRVRLGERRPRRGGRGCRSHA